MDLAKLIPLVMQASIGLIVFCIGLRSTPGDLSYLLRRPSLLVRSLLAMNVIMPLVAIGLAVAFKLHPAVEAALVILSVSPVPPILPNKQSKAGGNVSYAIGLLVFSAALAIVFVPAAVAVVGRLFGRALDVPTATIVKTVLTSVLLPLVLGVVVGRLASPFAERLAGPLSKIATLLLLLVLVPVLVKAWPAFAALVGDFTLVAILVFTLVSLAVGHGLGGPDPEDRTVLALSTASRHPAVAMSVVAATALPENRAPVSAAILLVVLFGALVAGPYVKWRKKSHAATAPTPAAAR